MKERYLYREVRNFNQASESDGRQGGRRQIFRWLDSPRGRGAKTETEKSNFPSYLKKKEEVCRLKSLSKGFCEGEEPMWKEKIVRNYIFKT